MELVALLLAIFYGGGTICILILATIDYFVYGPIDQDRPERNREEPVVID